MTQDVEGEEDLNKVTRTLWLSEHNQLLYMYDNGALLLYGAVVVPGTDVETYRFVYSLGFGGSQEAYKKGKSLATAYSRGLGFKGVQGHFESLRGQRLTSSGV